MAACCDKRICKNGHTDGTMQVLIPKGKHRIVLLRHQLRAHIAEVYLTSLRQIIFPVVKFSTRNKNCSARSSFRVTLQAQSEPYVIENLACNIADGFIKSCKNRLCGEVQCGKKVRLTGPHQEPVDQRCVPPWVYRTC